jgi:transcriptional regulator with AAA-type ATPase domain
MLSARAKPFAAKKVANTQATVLINGDSGTGKELFALALSTFTSNRCGSLPRSSLRPKSVIPACFKRDSR